MSFQLKIPTDIIIPLVEERPILWDKKNEGYRNSAAKAIAWQEITTILYPDFKKLSSDAMESLCKSVTSKWANVRDAFTRAERKYRENQANGVPNRPYAYRKKMKFMMESIGFGEKNISSETNFTIEALEESSDDEYFKPSSPNIIETLPKIKRIKQETQESDNQISFEATDVTQSFASYEYKDENRHMSFFKGLLPAITGFDEDETLELQAGVLEVIQKIRKKRRDPL